MTSKARAEFDPMAFGIRIAVMRDHGSRREMIHWGDQSVHEYEPETAVTRDADESWLRLSDEDARAIYEALADHFGHAGHDTRSLRNDYDAERRRVDKMLDALIKGGVR